MESRLLFKIFSTLKWNVRTSDAGLSFFEDGAKLNTYTFWDFPTFKPCNEKYWPVQIGHVLSHIKLANNSVMKLFAKILRIRCKKLNETGQMGIPLFEFVKITIFYLQKNIKVHIFWAGHKILRNLHLTFSVCTVDQGLLYLDGRNSQKYLHQTQANF